MPLDIVTVPCLDDNYAYLIKGPDGVALIDAPEAAPIIAALEARGWGLDLIMITHHHHDHVGGVAELRGKYNARVMGPKAEEAKLPPLDMAVEDGMYGPTIGTKARCIGVPGHTLGHVAYHFDEDGAVFTADSLMALGCGRVFEGTPEMMYESLGKLAALPLETMVYSGHEYTIGNGRFALTIEPDNPDLQTRVAAVETARKNDQPTAQVPLSLELATNPFLRAHLPEVKAALNMDKSTNVEVFAEIRARKDRF